MPTVRILNGPNRDQVYPLRGNELVGRDPGNEIQVFAPGVSRRHFQFKKEGAQFFLLDLGSSNGTYVNNQRVQRHPLVNADQITVGGINLLYQDDATPGGAAPRPALNFSQEDVPLGVFGAGAALFGATPAPVGSQTPAANKRPQGEVVLREDDEEEAGEDYSLDASIIFDAATQLPAEDREGALQKRLSLMFEISQMLGATHTQDEMLDRIMSKLFDVFPQADRGFILLGGKVEELVPVVVRHRRGDKAEVQVSRTIARKVLTERQAILSQNAMEDDRFSGGMSILNFRILSMAVAPLLFRDEVFGFIHLDTQDRAKKFTPDDLNLLAGIAAQAAIFIKNLKLFESVRKEAEARANLERYFSPALAERVASGEIDLKLGGDLKDGTVFFSDIIGFTSMSERLTAEDVVAKINRYMRYMVDIVFKYNGSVDKFIGDCIMAVWGAPLPMPDEAVAAVSAAVEMQNALFLFNGELRAENTSFMHMGIGLNSGSFVAGNMGSEKRMEYTVIGDNVNLAQRVESKAGRGMVLVSDTTYGRCDGKVVACKLRPVALKGKAQPVETYCVRGVEQGSKSGSVFMTSLPCAVNEWAEECDRGLLVKVKLTGPDQVLGLVIFYERPQGSPVKLEFYAPEMPRFQVDFHVQGDVAIQARHGCCLKGVFSIKGTPFEELFTKRVYASDKSPDDIPRAKTPV